MQPWSHNSIVLCRGHARAKLYLEGQRANIWTPKESSGQIVQGAEQKGVQMGPVLRTSSDAYGMVITGTTGPWSEGGCRSQRLQRMGYERCGVGPGRHAPKYGLQRGTWTL
mmetsp:Transcript_15434/g.24679  ORF Transcript_15434/g.24679 Transcript_15434/m.24679 type:complete len:111 (-) Transcript_15434:166-498(-)